MPSRRRFVMFGSIAAVVVAGVLGGRALADSSSQVASFRTATVKRATVSQTEQRSGIVEPVAAGTVAFPISGVVTGVGVQPGQTVTAGQTLASLDTSALQAQLTAQQATLAAAQLTLNNALNGVSTTPSGGSSSTNAARTTTTTAPSQTRAAESSTNASSPALASARQDVASGQQRVDDALSAAKTALGAAASSCSASKSSGSSPSPTSTTSSTSSTSTTTSTTTPPPSGPSQQCADDLQASFNAQQQVASAQSSLAQAEAKLDALLANASPTGSSSQQAATRSSAAASTPSLSGPTSAELVADQAAADAAQANVTAAQQELAQGTIVSPIDGTVAAVNMKVGDHVGAASSTENIVVVGPGGYEVTTTVPVTDIGNVKLGETASVVPDGSGSALDGKVVSIGVVPTTSGSTTVYPVVIGLNGAPAGLRNGATASVTITLNEVNDVLAVPTSAVRTAGAGAFHIVQVLSGSKTQTTPVQIGAVGSDLTEIKSGLQEGQQVVIADMNAPLPSNTITRLGGGGGLGGGGLGGGGGFVTIGRGG